MKISSIECGNASAGALTDAQARILPKDMPRKHTGTSAQSHATPLEQGIAVAMEALANVPDTREEFVEELRRQIQSGEYNVSGEDIADMMMRRRAADRIR